MTQTEEKKMQQADKMQIEYVPLSRIEHHKDVPNIRSKITGPELKELIDSIKNRGVMSPLSCWRTNGKIFLESGFRREEAAKQLKLKEVPVIFRDYTQPVRDALVGNMVENIEREDVNGMDLARRLQLLINIKMPKEEIARRISRSQSWISQTLAFLNVEKVDPKLHTMVSSGDITLNEGKDIAKLDLKHQAKVGSGLIQAKKIGDRAGASAIKDGVKRATRKSPGGKPSGKRLEVARNMASVIMGEMRKVGHGDTQDYFAVQGMYSGIKWALGEIDKLSLDKLAKEYDLKFGKDGFPAAKMAKDAKKKKKSPPTNKKKSKKK